MTCFKMPIKNRLLAFLICHADRWLTKEKNKKFVKIFRLRDQKAKKERGLFYRNTPRKFQFSALTIVRNRRGGDSPPGHFVNKMPLPEGNHIWFSLKIQIFSSQIFGGRRIAAPTMLYDTLCDKLEFSALTRECRMLNAECKIVVFFFEKWFK